MHVLMHMYQESGLYQTLDGLCSNRPNELQRAELTRMRYGKITLPGPMHSHPPGVQESENKNDNLLRQRDIFGFLPAPGHFPAIEHVKNTIHFCYRYTL